MRDQNVGDQGNKRGRKVHRGHRYDSISADTVRLLKAGCFRIASPLGKNGFVTVFNPPPNGVNVSDFVGVFAPERNRSLEAGRSSSANRT